MGRRMEPSAGETTDLLFGGVGADQPPMAGRPRVVLADDDDIMRAYVQRLLEEGGYEVEAVADGMAALAAIRRGPAPDLVLTDVMMPELDGFGLLMAVRADPALEGQLVVLLSAQAGEDAQVQGLTAGADDYLVKPFSPRELRARVDGAVRLSRQRREAALREQELRAEIVAERGRAVLRRAEQQLELAVEAGRLGSWDYDLETGRVIASDYCRLNFGVAAGEPFDRYEQVTARVHPKDREMRQQALDDAVLTGNDLEVEHRVIKHDGQVGWVLSRGRAVYQGGRPVRIAGVSLDITDRKKAEERQKLLLDELNHRVKNTLATVQSIAAQTRRFAADQDDFDRQFFARVQALAHAHDLLTEASWEGASLTDVVARTLSPHLGAGEASRVSLSGPPVRLGPNAAVTLNMAFHELATNAAKYGSLSVEHGRVEVHWRAVGGAIPEAIEIHWLESGGPSVEPPRRRGFGSRLIEQGLARELAGETKLVFDGDGLSCRMRFPLSAKLELAA